jgi:hypothetical protein
MAEPADQRLDGASGGSIWPSLTTAQLSCPTENQ